MDYPCAKFGDFSFSRFGFIVRTDRQTESHTDRITEADQRYTHATTVGVSKYTYGLGTLFQPSAGDIRHCCTDR